MLQLTAIAPPVTEFTPLSFDWIEKYNFDLKVRRTLYAIKMIESRGNYSAKGLAGEYGCYQFMPGTWKKLSLKYTGKRLDIKNNSNQDTIAKLRVEELTKYYTPEQIASIWNSGSSKWEGKKGINKFGVKYDVEKHVSNFKKIYYNL